MQANIDTVHRQIGELAAMSHQTEEAERKILARAEELLTKVEKELPSAASKAMTGGGDRYRELIDERGRLQQVIAQSRHVLGS